MLRHYRLHSLQTGQRQCGFTLLEMLLALMVFAMLGIATSTVLSNTIQGHETLSHQNEQLTELQRTFTIIERDFYQLAQRYARLNGEEPNKQLLMASEYLFDSEGVGFGFVRDGWTNPAMVLPRSEMQPVAYRVFEETLQRLYFNFVDPDVGTEPRVQDLMQGIEGMELAFFIDNEWQTELPENELPFLVKLTLKSQTYGQIARTFPLIHATTAIQAQTGNGNGNGNGAQRGGNQSTNGTKRD